MEGQLVIKGLWTAATCDSVDEKMDAQALAKVGLGVLEKSTKAKAAWEHPEMNRAAWEQLKGGLATAYGGSRERCGVRRHYSALAL
jgi:hypothetical protein